MNLALVCRPISSRFSVRFMSGDEASDPMSFTGSLRVRGGRFIRVGSTRAAAVCQMQLGSDL